jgi:hypothetical protein
MLLDVISVLLLSYVIGTELSSCETKTRVVGQYQKLFNK